MKLDADWIWAPATQAVTGALTQAGFQALFVGGCVRNTLLGAAVTDIDIATDARPEQVMDIMQTAGLRAIPTGIDHGTITVVSAHVPHEVTTFRRDIATDGRHAVVAFASTVAADAHRRDFTMNALYATPEGTVIDPLGGLADLRARHIRFIDDAQDRIHEDYLRILRFFRFFAWYGDQTNGIDAEGLAACAANLDGLETLSRERVGAEIMKLLAAPNPAPAVAAMSQAGVLARVIPAADATPLSLLVSLESENRVAPAYVRRLAALGGQALRDALRLSRKDANRLDQLRNLVGGLDGPAALGYRFGAEIARDVLLLRGAIFAQPLGDGWADSVRIGASAILPVKACDLMPRFRGAELGARLKALEARWIASDFKLTREALLA